MDVTRHHTFSWSEITDAEIGKQAKLNYCMAFLLQAALLSPFPSISHRIHFVQYNLGSSPSRQGNQKHSLADALGNAASPTNYPYYQKVNVHHTQCPRVQTPERQESRPGSGKTQPS